MPGGEMSEAPRAVEFVCDDRAGFALRVYAAPDGDFHLSIVPVHDDLIREGTGYAVPGMPERTPDNQEYREELYETYIAPHVHGFPPSVRIRMPMIGGGSHSELWHALAKVLRKRERTK